MPSPLILIADPHPITRAGIKAVLSEKKERRTPFTFIETANGRTAVELAQKHKPALAIMDVRLADLNGLIVAGRIIESGLGTRVLICTALDTDFVLHNTIAYGAQGYLNKNTAIAQLPEAVAAILGGTNWYDAAARRHLADHNGLPNRNRNSYSSLSTREQDVACLIIAKRSTKQIADELQISEHTVEHHRANLFKKFNTTNQVDLVHRSYENGYAFHQE